MGTYEGIDAAGKAQSFTKDAWGWLIPLLMPTLGLIFATLIATWNAPALKDKVRTSFYRTALWLSVFYLASIIATLLVQPFRVNGPEDAIALMRMSNFWMGPAQGVMASVLGVMFLKRT